MINARDNACFFLSLTLSLIGIRYIHSAVPMIIPRGITPPAHIFIFVYLISRARCKLPARARGVLRLSTHTHICVCGEARAACSRVRCADRRG